LLPDFLLVRLARRRIERADRGPLSEELSDGMTSEV
jgi:hypothetical protein